MGNMYKQIGNAVPVLLGKKIAEVIKKELIKYEKEKNTTFQKKESNGSLKRVRIIRTEVSQ